MTEQDARSSVGLDDLRDGFAALGVRRGGTDCATATSPRQAAD
jgi:hypothetical protein